MEQNCSICLDYGVDYKTNCGHYFHRKCIEEWVIKNRSCPYCRAHLNWDKKMVVAPKVVKPPPEIQSPPVVREIAQQAIKRTYHKEVFCILCIIFFGTGLAMSIIGGNIHGQNTFVFKEPCKDIPKNTKAFLINKNQLEVEIDPNNELCVYLDAKPYGCNVAYNSFEKYIENCTISNKDNLKQRNVRDEKVAVLLGIGVFVTVFSGGILFMCICVVVA